MTNKDESYLRQSLKRNRRKRDAEDKDNEAQRLEDGFEMLAEDDNGDDDDDEWEF